MLGCLAFAFALAPAFALAIPPHQSRIAVRLCVRVTLTLLRAFDDVIIGSQGSLPLVEAPHCHNTKQPIG